jgi:hypothetical protein
VPAALTALFLALAAAAAGPDRPAAGTGATTMAPRTETAISTVTIAGTVQLDDGTPVVGAVIVTPLGGQGVSSAGGAFRLSVPLARRTQNLTITAVGQVGGTTVNGTASVGAVQPGDVIDAGPMLMALGGSCDPAWLPTFGGHPGAGDSGTISALAVYDDGHGPALYAAGEFTDAGGVPANRIARWDGSSWSALGSGIEGGAVVALAVYDDGGGPALYAGGSFTSAGGVPASRIARWDGASWSALGSGMNGVVRALAMHDDGGGPALYAGGDFTSAGGVPADRIARWDGASWSALGSGMAGGAAPRVHALTEYDDGGGPALYAGGGFTSAGGVSASNIARWDGVSWSSLDSGTTGVVAALTVYDDGGGGGPALYAGGLFASAGGVTANHIARWDGAAWAALGSGMNNDIFGNVSVAVLSVFDDGGEPALYAGGTFTTAGGLPASRIARWDGSSWSAAGSGVSIEQGTSAVRALAVYDDGSSGAALHAGGIFTNAGGLTADHIARWNGLAWSTLGIGTNGPVFALTVHDDGGGPDLYAGGGFTTVSGVTANRIARWDGSSWSPLGSGMSGGSVFALAAYDDGGGPDLYAGGGFTSAGGVAASSIARWNGSAWSALGSGMSGGPVFALAVFDDGGGPTLYAGGGFFAAGGVAASNIARWNGSAWSALGSGVGGGSVNALAVFDDGSGPALYVGGSFSSAGGVPATGIARWNGSAWSALGSGVGGSVFALAVHDDGGGLALYAGGFFFTDGGGPANFIARWDGASWSPLGPGTDHLVSTLAVFDDGGGSALYAGGFFVTAGGKPAKKIARWDGSSWSPLGNGMSGGFNALVDELTVYDDGGGPALFAGGNFTSAIDSADSYIAKWGCTEATPCPADVDGDGQVNVIDLVEVIFAWGSSGSDADANEDGMVDVLDLVAVLLAWGPCPG